MWNWGVSMTTSLSHCRTRAWQVLAGTLLFIALLDSHAADMSGENTEATADTYSRDKDTHGVVLISVDWGRRWNFCGAENVQLRTFAFDRVPVLKQTDDEAADLLLKAPPSLTAGPGTVGHYALLVEPGEYALSYSELKVARSVNKVDTYTAGRKIAHPRRTIPGRQLQGGSRRAGLRRPLCDGLRRWTCQ